MFLRSSRITAIAVIVIGSFSTASHSQAPELRHSPSLQSGSGASQASDDNSSGHPRSQVAAIVAQIKLADFEDDRAKLEELYQKLTPYLQSESLAPSVRYWRGFALWRRALNGFNDSTNKEELDSDLSRASQEFESAAAGRSGFVEAAIGESACEGTLVFLHHKEPEQMQRHLQLEVSLTKNLTESASNNPRFLWVLGGSLWNRPAAAGGSQTVAIETYRRGLATILSQQNNAPDPIEPSWGEAELLMSLAWSYLHRSTPDFDEADRYAHKALQVAPTWHFVRDILLPLIAEGRAKNVTPKSTSSTPTIVPMPIFYDQELAARGFPSPLIKIRIAGHDALFIVDSGAGVNTLADWFAAQAGIATEATSSRAQGSTGKENTIRVARNIQGELSDGEPLNLSEAAVVAFPALFESLHLGGLVSPQLLAPRGMAAVLDLTIPSLRFAPFAATVSKLKRAASSSSPSSETEACVNHDSIFVNRLYLTPVSISGMRDLLLVDTGATATIFSEGSKIARELSGRTVPGPQSEGVGGAMVGTHLVPAVALQRGGSIVTLNASIGDVSRSCDGEGILGMDALRACLLVLGEQSIALSCN